MAAQENSPPLQAHCGRDLLEQQGSETPKKARRTLAFSAQIFPEMAVFGTVCPTWGEVTWLYRHPRETLAPARWSGCACGKAFIDRHPPDGCAAVQIEAEVAGSGYSLRRQSHYRRLG